MRLVVLAHGPMLEGVHVDRDRPNPGVGGTQFTRLRLAQEFAARFPQHEVEVVSDRTFGLTPGQRNLRLTLAADLEQRLGDLASETDPWVMTAPSMLLRHVAPDVLRGVAPRSIVTSHLMHDADLWEVERHMRFGAAGCIGAFHYHATRSRSPRVYLRDLFLPGWPAGGDAAAGRTRHDDGTDHGSPFRIVHVGALLPLKGFHDLASQWPSIRTLIPDARLDVIGGSSTYGRAPDHPMIPTSKAFGDEVLRHIPVEDLQARRVTFHGNLGAEKVEIIGRADVAVLNVGGREESLNAALIECLDLGVPVVGSAAHGLWDTMRHFPECTTRSPAEVVARLRMLVDDPGMRSVLSQRAVEVAGGFRAENDAIVARWEEVATALLEGRTPPTFAPTPAPRPTWSHRLEHTRRRTRYAASRSALAQWRRDRRRGVSSGSDGTRARRDRRAPST